MTGTKKVWWVPDAVFTKGQLISGVAVRIKHGQIVELRKQNLLPKNVEIRSLNGIMTPGLIDLQVNGGGGVMFNMSPNPEAIDEIIKAHRTVGTANLLPTVITDDATILRQAVSAVQEAWGLEGLIGIHIEGPHLSFERRGTHKPEFLRPMCHETQALVEQLRCAGIPTMITVAPEMITSTQISALAETGAVVSLGHSNATYATAMEAIEAGAQCFTHLYNGMSQMGHREPGMVGAALTSDAFV